MKRVLFFLLFLISNAVMAQFTDELPEIKRISEEDFMTIKNFIYPKEGYPKPGIDTARYLTLADNNRLKLLYSIGSDKFTGEYQYIIISVVYPNDYHVRIYQLSREWTATRPTKEGPRKTAKSVAFYRMLFFKEAMHPDNKVLNKQLRFKAIIEAIKRT